MKKEWRVENVHSVGWFWQANRLIIDDEPTDIFVVKGSDPHIDLSYFIIENLSYYIPRHRKAYFDTEEEAKDYVVKFHPIAHECIEHPTYTGPGCAICAKEKKSHYEKKS